MTGPYEVWVWLIEESDGRDGAIAALLPGLEKLGPLVLQNPRREVAEGFRPVAEAHGKAAGRPIRLAHLREEGWNRVPFVCPRCGAASHSPIDKVEGYCGRCHDWTGVGDDTDRV